MTGPGHNSVASDGCKPISDAPRDGTVVELLFPDGAQVFAHWIADDREGVLTADGAYHDEMRPTHWRGI